MRRSGRGSALDRRRPSAAGLVVWALSYVFQAIVGGQSLGSVVVIIAWTGVEMLIASSVGGYLYLVTSRLIGSAFT